MKNRSHRLPPSDPPDDWINGSWTVDCSCGVTFDDGEEMVSCDECGVWVHTRCSHFVKGEISFACHNCKNNNDNSSKRSSLAAAAETEETEVAQLLIELPTKADPCPPSTPFPGPTYCAPFCLWAEVPLEERVHVQGVPGGDPALFRGISSSVFTSELWKCIGYVPKKFNFQYREFPCWDEDAAENPANVLFSLSKEIVPSCGPVRAFERKQEGAKVLFGNRLQSWGKKERNKLRVLGSRSSKRRKDEVGEGKDRGGKKKKVRRDADRVAAEFKKRVSVPVADTKKAELCEDGGLQVLESDVPSLKSEERKEDPPSQDSPCEQGERSDTGDQVERMDSDSKPKHVLVIKTSKGGVADEASRLKNASEVRVKIEAEDGIGTTGISPKADVSAASKEKEDDNVKESVKEEDLSKDVHDLKQPKDESHYRGDPNSSIQDKLRSSDSCQKNEKMNQPVPQPPSKLLSHSVSVHPPASASAVTTLSDGEDLSKVVHDLKQPKDQSHSQGDQKGSAQAKLVSSGSCQKNENINQPVPQPLSKLLGHSMSMHLPASASAATTLSDEELALLLHQELNSSPRVPRVPRMRQASGMQLTSQSAGPSMLLKCPSHSGGKDQVFRRKNKEEASRVGSRNSQESINETKKAGRAMSSSDRKYRESSFRPDGSAKKDSRNMSPDTVVRMKKNMSGASTEGENRCQLSCVASGQNALSIKSSPRDVPDDDTTTHTLPGLIDEILSKRKCSTYKELCDAVRPHWHNVRKANGDRYAYSSHSHAVLDCLRNRSEWAHLLGRGSKINSSKRRQKLDSDTPTVKESENEEVKKKASPREVEDKIGDSHREDFPKGKRKARKRRRLELRGQSVEEARKRKHATSSGSAIVSDEDDHDDDESAVAFSHSSNEGADGIFSEDENQGAVDHAVGAETSASASSDCSR